MLLECDVDDQLLLDIKLSLALAELKHNRSPGALDFNNSVYYYHSSSYSMWIG